MYYIIEKGHAVEATLPNTSNAQTFIAAQSQAWRHERGIYAHLVIGPVDTPTADQENDQIIIPMPPPTPPPVPTYSKIGLVRAFDSRGLLDALLAFLDSHPKHKVYWDAAMTLDADDPLMVEALSGMAELALPQEVIDAILQEAICQ